MRSKPKVLFIQSTPATRLSSGYHVRGANSPVLEKLSRIYDIESFNWSKRQEQTINPNKVYLLDGFQIFFNLLNCLLKGKFNAIVTTGIPVLESIPAFIIAKLLHIPIMIKETHWYWPNTKVSKLTWPINKIMVSNCNLVICPGKRAYEYWRLLGVPEKKITIVPFYTSILQVNPEINQLSLNIRSKFNDSIIVLYFGRFIRKKGIDYLVNAFAKIQKDFDNVVLLLAGDGPERNNLEALCSNFDLDAVAFAGAIDEQIKAAYFLAADIYVYPSVLLELPEEWPIGLVEAMSVGKPVVVTSAVGSAPDVVQHGINGYVVQEKNSEALYLALKKLIENENLRRNMGWISKEIVEKNYSYNKAAQSLDDAIKTVIART